MDKKDVRDVKRAFKKYCKNNDAHNLKTLCAEIEKMCDNIYSSLYNIESKNIYYAMADNIAKV